MKSYMPCMEGDPLSVEKGNCHFRKEGQKDFLCRIRSFEQILGGAAFLVETFRKKTARAELYFISETAYRLRMFPDAVIPEHTNQVFDLKPIPEVSVKQEKEEFLISTKRVTLRVRICPWQVITELDGEELTKEQIKDHNVDQKYKAVPLGFTRNAEGKVTDAFETMYLYNDEEFYGFGEKFNRFCKRGQKLTVWQRDAQSTNSNVSYKGMPYYMSSSGYAVLLNTYTRTHFNMGADSFVSATMETEDPYLDYCMFCNRDYKGLIRDYTAMSGRSPMIPRWAFGFWMSKMSYNDRQEVETVAEKMAAFGMSADVVHIDGWMDMNTQDEDAELLSFDETRFPHPEEMIANLQKKGLHLSLWMFPYVPAKDAEGQEFGLYRSMKKRGFLVKNQTGEPCIFTLGEGDVGGFLVAALDFTNPKLVSYLHERVGRLMKMGVGVMKTDFSEEIPADAVFYDGSSGLESHNKYPLLYAKTIYEASKAGKQETKERALLWGRSGYLGSQNYPANWAGDSSAATNNLAALLNGGLSMGICGVSFWGFDIGGFYHCDEEGKRAIPSEEEYIRSVQMGLMSPLSRSHGQATPREPWVFGKQAQEAFLQINKLRYRLLPYLYSIAWETCKEGIPMMRAMLLEYPKDINARTVSGQYMLGNALLAAPVFDRKIKQVYLPEGSFVELYHNTRIAGNRWIEVEADLMQIPLYLRENSVLYLQKQAPMHSSDAPFADLELWMNLTDRLYQEYYEDETKGEIWAAYQDSTVVIQSRKMDFSSVRAYLPSKPKQVVVNGVCWQIEKIDKETYLCKGERT